MIPGDIGAQLTAIVSAAVDSGELPSPSAGVSAYGTWRPAPAQASGRPGTYATSLPFALANMTSRTPQQLAGQFADSLRGVPWISSARVTGRGYLTVTVTAAHLTGLAARITAAGPAAASTDALAGAHLNAPHLPDLLAAGSWHEAWRDQRDALTGRLAQAAGAKVNFVHIERKGRAASPGKGDSGDVPHAVAYYGPYAVRYALARTASGRSRAIAEQLSVPLNIKNPFLAVRYAHADAASTLRWAAELGQPVTAGDRVADHLQANTSQGERRLLDLLSWLPERVAAAARRRRPAELTAYLESLAGAWLDCQENSPALPFRGAAAPREAASSAARLRLADAVRVTFATGLGLLGVAAPDRI